MYRAIKVLLLVVISISSYSQQVTISGIEKTYAGDELVFFTYADLITKNEVELGRSLVDTGGNFEFNFEIDEVKLAFVYLEIYKGFIYLEPDSSYRIKLPPKTPKVFEDEINPYFVESEFFIGIVNAKENELNYLIKKFDNEFNKYLGDNFTEVRYRGTRDIDTIINKWQESYKDFQNPYFQNYKYYKLAALRHMAYERNANMATRYYYLNKPFLYNNTAYMELFNQLFANYFFRYSKTKNGERIYTDVAYAKSISKIKETLDLNMALDNDTLKELVIMKACFDESYSNAYPYRALKQTLDSLVVLTKVAKHKKIAINIINTTKHLRAGFEAPNFKILNNKDEISTLKDYRGKYLYLNFCADWSYVCKEELSLLKTIYKNHKDNLEIVTITPKEDFTKLTAFFEENNYDWPLKYTADKELLTQYKIVVYPMYYLIDPYGKLSMSPAPSPNENFEWRFFKVLRSRK